MKRLMLLFSIVIASLFIAGPVMATPFSSNVTNDAYSQGNVNGIPTANDDNDGIPDINDAVNRILGTSYGNNWDVDDRFVEPDEIWKKLDGEIALIGLTAGYKNSVGYYTGLGTGLGKSHVLGPYSGFGFAAQGTQADPYPGGKINGNLPSGSLFGWYLHANQSTHYYSEAGLNAGGWDHMMTFKLESGKKIWVDFGEGAVEWELQNPYLIAWEDLPWNGSTLGDDDYDDMMYVVDKVAPIPEPGTLLLLGSGLAGLGGFARLKLRRRRNS